MQQVGRVIRTAEGKENAIILDHAGNSVRFGLPRDFEVPDLGEKDAESAKKKRKKKKLSVCQECDAVIPPDARSCPVCGVDRATRVTDVHNVDVDLVAYGSGETGQQEFSPKDKKRWYQSFVWYTKRHNIKQGWAYHKYLEKFGHKPPWSWRDLPPMEPDMEVLRYIRSRQIAYAKGKARA